MFTTSQPILDVSDHWGPAVPDGLCLMPHVPVILDSAIEDISFPAESSRGQRCPRQGQSWDSEQSPRAQGIALPAGSCLLAVG